MVRLAIACVAGAAFAAHADSVDVEFLGVGNGSTASVSLNDSLRFVFIGQLNHRFSNAAGEPIEGDYVTYCTDLTQYVTHSARTYTVEHLKDMPKSPNVPSMGTDRAQAIFDLVKAAKGKQLGEDADRTFTAAFQLALWEIVYDFDGQAASLDTGAGAFKVNNVRAEHEQAVNSHLTSLFSEIGNGGTGEGLYGVASWEAQDQLLVVPLPAPVLLGGIGLGALVVARRRFIRA